MNTLTREELDKALDLHAKWVRGEEGSVRADFRGMDLCDIDLAGVCLRGAYLQNVNFRGADLRGTDFRRAYLQGADLRDTSLCFSLLRVCDLRRVDFRGSDCQSADFRCADLRGAKGFYLLPVQDPRGYPFPHATECLDGWRIRVGCRDFAIDEARKHWGAGYEGDRVIGDMYIHAIDWLEQRIAEDAA